MIEEHVIAKLKDRLSRHGQVKSITAIPSSVNATCALLADMESMHDALSVQHQYGFMLFGHTSLIIRHDWLVQNLIEE